MEIIVTEAGLGREVNPHIGSSQSASFLYATFEDNVKTLPAYQQDGKTPLEVGKYEARLVPQEWNGQVWQECPVTKVGMSKRFAYYEIPPLSAKTDEVKEVEHAIKYEQLLTLEWNKEFGHQLKPGYDNIDGNKQYFGTDPQGKRIIQVNAEYAGHTFVKILEDGGTRTVFNGHVRSFDELKLINSLVL